MLLAWRNGRLRKSCDELMWAPLNRASAAAWSLICSSQQFIQDVLEASYLTLQPTLIQTSCIFDNKYTQGTIGAFNVFRDNITHGRVFYYSVQRNTKIAEKLCSHQSSERQKYQPAPPPPIKVSGNGPVKVSWRDTRVLRYHSGFTYQTYRYMQVC